MKRHSLSLLYHDYFGRCSDITFLGVTSSNLHIKDPPQFLVANYPHTVRVPLIRSKIYSDRFFLRIVTLWNKLLRVHWEQKSWSLQIQGQPIYILHVLLCTHFYCRVQQSCSITACPWALYLVIFVVVCDFTEYIQLSVSDKSWCILHLCFLFCWKPFFVFPVFKNSDKIVQLFYRPSTSFCQKYKNLWLVK